MTYSPFPPRRIIADHTAYDIVCDADSKVRFRVFAQSSTAARIEALDKIGYVILVDGSKFTLVDADDHDEVELLLQANTYEQALTESFAHVHWTVSEPIQMIGGAVGEGFGGFDDE